MNCAFHEATVVTQTMTGDKMEGATRPRTSFTRPEMQSQIRVDMARLRASASEEICFLHDTKELFLVDFPITVSVCLINHLLELLVCHALSKLLGNPLQIFKGDLAGFIIIEQTESFQDLILGVAVQDLVRHHFQELLVLNS